MKLSTNIIIIKYSLPKQIKHVGIFIPSTMNELMTVVFKILSQKKKIMEIYFVNL